VWITLPRFKALYALVKGTQSLLLAIDYRDSRLKDLGNDGVVLFGTAKTHDSSPSPLYPSPPRCFDRRCDKFVRNKFERWNLRQRPERRRAGRPESFTTVQDHERAKLCEPLVLYSSSLQLRLWGSNPASNVGLII